MSYFTRSYNYNPRKVTNVSPHGGGFGQGQPAVNGYYPDIEPGSSKGGPREVAMGGTLHDGVSNIRPSRTQFDSQVQYQRMPYYRNPSPYVPPEDQGRLSGRQDPLASGPERPTLHTMSRSNYTQRGTTNTRQLDNQVIAFSTVGAQDGVSYVTTMDPIGSNPRLSAPSDRSNVIKIAPSGPHGLHSRSPKKMKAVSNANYVSKAQQVAIGQNRLANSNRNGQSFSATTVQLQTAVGAYTRGGGVGGGR